MTIQRGPNLIDQSAFSENLLALLTANDTSLGKKASTALGAFAIVLNKDDLIKLTSELLACIDNCQDKEQ